MIYCPQYYQSVQVHLNQQSKICCGHGGLIIYLHNTLSYELRNIYTRSDTWEGLFIDITSDNFVNKITLGNIYRPPKDNNNTTNIETFINELAPLINRFGKEKTTNIIVGDFNVDLMKIAEREKYANVFDMFCTNSFLPKITFPTSFAKHSCSLIDQIYYKPYTNSGTTNTVTAGIILSTISDHFPSFISLNVKRTSPKIPKFVTISRYTSEAVENIRGDLIAENISLKMCPTHENNSNLMYDIFENCITKIKQKHMPCISVKFKKHKHKLSNWISYGILHSIKCRDTLYKQLKTTHVDTPEYIRLKTNLDNYNKVLKQSIRAAKQTHYYDIFNEHRNDIQKTWTSLKNVLNQGKGYDKFPNVFLIDHKMCSDKDLIANKFNEYFTQIGPRLAGNIYVANKRSYESYLRNPCEVEYNFTRTTPEERVEIIRKMKPKSSSGLDNISCRLVKDISDIIAIPLTSLINQSFNPAFFQIN